MPLRVRVEPTRLVVSLATDPPMVGYWRLLDSNTIGLVAVAGSAFQAQSGQLVISSSTFFIARSTGFIRWVEAGADTLPLTDRTGTCVDAP